MAEIKVPANQRIKLSVHNQDGTPEEFESHALNREKVIAGNSKATIYIGPLEPGRYTFFGEFNEATAQGAIVANAGRSWTIRQSGTPSVMSLTAADYTGSTAALNAITGPTLLSVSGVAAAAAAYAWS